MQRTALRAAADAERWAVAIIGRVVYHAAISESDGDKPVVSQ
jgi:hypothetical protein